MFLYYFVIQEQRELEELDLGFNFDGITGATPGYGEDVKPPHLRKEGTGTRHPFMVVPGLRNLALYKPVTGSEKPARGDLEQLTDGLIKCDEFDYVEGPEWVQIDLGNILEIHAVVIWHFYKNPIIYNDVIVQAADDAAFSANVRTLFNNDHDNSAGFGRGEDTAYICRWWGEIVDARGADHSGTTAGYVRVYTGRGMNGEPPAYVEVAVYGRPPEN